MNPVFTVGHSNHPLETFVQILKGHGVAAVVDVRRHPGSRKWPHFNAAALSASLGESGLAYIPMPELGGRRKPRADSPHAAWRVDAFRGYADFMDTPEFGWALDGLIARSTEAPLTLMCAEALPWRCHRSLIADALVARGVPVLEILSEREKREHKLPAFARLDGERVVYDGAEEVLPIER